MYTRSTAVFLHHKCQLSNVSDKFIYTCDNFRIKSLSYSEKGAILCLIYFQFLHFFIWSWKTCQLMWENFFSLLYSTLVTSCIVDPFLCCHLFYLIIYLQYILFGLSIWNVMLTETPSYRDTHTGWDFRDCRKYIQFSAACVFLWLAYVILPCRPNLTSKRGIHCW